MYLRIGKRAISSLAKEFFQNTSLKAVVGASVDKSKFGNKVLCCLVANKYEVVPINSKVEIIENIPTLANLNVLKDIIDQHSTFKNTSSMSDVGLSIITPPVVTLEIITTGLKLGIRYYFLQPGTDDTAVRDFIAVNMKDCIVVHGCVLQELGC